MRKLITAFLTVWIVLTLSACTNSQESGAEVSTGDNQSESSSQASTEIPSQVSVDDSSSKESAPVEIEIDYTPYSALLNAYELDYNIQNVNGTDYEVTGMTILPTNPEDAENGLVDASGFCYANLVDFDNNGVLELVIIAYDEQERVYDEDFGYGDKIHIDELKYPYIMKVYTIMQEGGLTFLGSLPLSQLELPVSQHYGIEYIVSEDKTYIRQSRVSNSDEVEIRYYGLADGYFGVQLFFAQYSDGTALSRGEVYTFEEYEALTASYGESEVHLIQNLDEDNLRSLEELNDKTFSFLEEYPTDNFTDYSGAYNDGQFYYFEHNSEERSPPELVIKEYYEALTTRDYDTLYEIMANDEMIENYKLWHSSDTHTYVPGYVITQLRYVELENIVRDDMETYIGDLINGLYGKDVTIMYAAVNEILDPHTAQLGLQVAGDIYDTYYILSSEDDSGENWQIEEIVDNKFFWG